MMHDPRHWRLTLIYKAMFNVIFLFFFLQKYRWMYGFWGSIHAWKNLCQCIYAIYAYSIYIYIYFKLDSNSIASRHLVVFQCRGLNYLFVFSPFHIEGILLKVWYSWFKEVARHEPKKQQHIFRDVLPTLLTLFFLFLPFVTSSLTEHHLSPSSLREIYACSLLRSSSLLGSFLTST